VAPFVEAEEAPYTQLERIEDFEGSVDGATGIVPWAEDRHRRIDSALADRE
jgi:hypothetical protein